MELFPAVTVVKEPSTAIFPVPETTSPPVGAANDFAANNKVAITKHLNEVRLELVCEKFMGKITNIRLLRHEHEYRLTQRLFGFGLLDLLAPSRHRNEEIDSARTRPQLRGLH